MQRLKNAIDVANNAKSSPLVEDYYEYYFNEISKLKQVEFQPFILIIGC